MHSRTLAALLLTCLCLYGAASHGAADGSRLDRPTGAPVAIVVFEDLQCPDCRRAHPELLKAAARHEVPLVIRDFPIRRHAWAFPAAILARWFTLHSAALGAEFRSYVFENQPGITPANLRDYAERFAQQRGLELPPDVDPAGRLQAAVQADYDLAIAIGLEYVPLVFVLAPGRDAERAQEVTDLAQLDAAIEKAKRRALSGTRS
jgi:protein-disulfide isomerase